MLKLYIKTGFQDILPVEINSTDSILCLEAMILEKMCLQYNAEILDHNKRISDYDVKTNSIMTFRIRPRLTYTLYIKMVTGKTLTIKVKRTDTLAMVKMKLEVQEQVSLLNQLFFLNGYLLSEWDRPLVNYGINSDALLELIYFSPTSTSITNDANTNNKNIQKPVATPPSIQQPPVTIMTDFNNNNNNQLDNNQNIRPNINNCNSMDHQNKGAISTNNISYCHNNLNNNNNSMNQHHKNVNQPNTMNQPKNITISNNNNSNNNNNNANQVNSTLINTIKQVIPQKYQCSTSLPTSTPSSSTLIPSKAIKSTSTPVTVVTTQINSIKEVQSKIALSNVSNELPLSKNKYSTTTALSMEFPPSTPLPKSIMNDILVKVNVYSNMEIEIAMKQDAKVITLKNRICDHTNIIPQMQGLTYEGLRLQDNKKLIEYGINNGSLIDMLALPPPLRKKKASTEPNGVNSKTPTTTIATTTTTTMAPSFTPINNSNSNNINNERAVLKNIKQELKALSSTTITAANKRYSLANAYINLISSEEENNDDGNQMEVNKKRKKNKQKGSGSTITTATSPLNMNIDDKNGNINANTNDQDENMDIDTDTVPSNELLKPSSSTSTVSSSASSSSSQQSYSTPPSQIKEYEDEENENENENKIKIKIKSTNGIIKEIKVGVLGSLLDVMKEVEKTNKIPIKGQKYIFGGTTLSRHSLVKDLYLDKDSIVHFLGDF